ncbi:MAG: fibronectin type III domain-containing protein, partial [Phycisphaerae bacterium]
TDNSDNETGFKILRKTGAGGEWGQIDTVGADVTTYNDTGLAGLTTYYYRVRAYNEVGNSAYSNEANATTEEE